MKKTQEEFVIGILETNGEISRNFCLQNYITRLGAIIYDLKKQGWEFETESRSTTKPDGSKGRDFIYKAIDQIKLPF